MRVLVTGASGFVGGALLTALAKAGHEVRAAVRNAGAWSPPDGIEAVSVGDVGPETDWRAALDGIETVVHLAGRAHVTHETAADPLAAARRVNVEGTRRLAAAAMVAGVRRLVYLSSVKAMGERTRPGAPFTEADEPRPEDAYGISKLEAERWLAEAADGCRLETVVVRSPLVYGPGVKGNFLALLQLCARGLPLPLGSVANARSLVYVGNLADALLRCAEHPATAGQTFLVRDGEDVSTPELIRRLCRALNRPARLFPFPPPLLAAGAAALGRSAAAARLLGSLTVDDARIREILGWQPPFGMVEGLRRTAAWTGAPAER